MKIKIKVTKEIYRKSMMCGTLQSNGKATENCAIAIAVRDIAPNAKVSYSFINWGYSNFLITNHNQKEFIYKFDELKHTPEKRLDLPEFEFEVDFPNELVTQIGIDEVKDILSKSETLELVTV